MGWSGGGDGESAQLVQPPRSNAPPPPSHNRSGASIQELGGDARRRRMEASEG